MGDYIMVDRTCALQKYPGQRSMVKSMDRTAKVSIANIAILCMVIKGFMKISAAIPVVGFVDMICTFLYILCVVVLSIFQMYTVKEFVLIGATAVTLLYTTIVTGMSDPMLTFLFIVAIKELDIDDIIKKIYICYCVMLFVHAICTVFFAVTGSIPMVIHMRGIDRYTLGFAHPNATGATFFVLMMLSLWTGRGKKGQVLFWAIVSTIVYLLCRSRTAYMVSLVTIVQVYVIKTQKVRIINLINKLALVVFPCIASIMYIIIRLYDIRHPIALLADKVINARVRLGAYAMERVGLTVFGKNIDFYGTHSVTNTTYSLSTFTFDCVYSFIFCSMGLLYLGILTILFFKLARKKLVWINAAIIIWCLYAVTEVSGLNGFAQFPIFYLTLLLNGNHKKEIKVGEMSND